MGTSAWADLVLNQDPFLYRYLNGVVLEGYVFVFCRVL